MATNVEIQKLFISVPKGPLSEYFMANVANEAIVDPKKIYFFEDGRIWTNGRTYSKSDEEFEAIFTGIDEKISAEEARAIAAEQLLTDNLAKEVTDRTQAIEAEAALREADVEALQNAIDQAVADAKSYSVAKVEEDELRSELDETVREAYKLVDEDGNKCGEYIKIYKDSAIESVVYENQNLIITYILADGSKSVATIDMAQMIIEQEHGDGLQVVDHVVSVKRDETSEAFLSVSAEGIKVSGVQAAIDAAVAAEKAERIADVDEEQTRAEAAEAKLTQDLANEAIIARAAEQANAQAIADEKTRAEGQEAAIRQEMTRLSEQALQLLNEGKAELQAAIEAETQAREQADNVEKERAESVEAGLQSAIDAEKARAEAKEAELEGKLGSTNEGHIQDIADVRAELAAETSRAEDKETELAGLIDAEQARAEAAEQANADAIAAEEERAIAVENTKVDWTYLGGERKAITLANHDLLLGTATNGGTYNIGMISKWDVVDLGTTSLPINLNTPAGVRPTVQEAGKSGEEAEKIAFLSDVDSANANLSAAIEAEAARAKAAEETNAAAIAALSTSSSDALAAAKAELEGKLAIEKERAEQAEADLQTAIDAEQTRAEQAEADLQGKLDQEVVDREGADIELQGAIDTEKARAEQAEGNLQDALDAEIERAKAAEENNNSIAGIATEMVVAETDRATGEEQRIEGKLDTEITRATDEEKRIEDKFDAAIAKNTYSVVKLTDEELAGLSDAANVKEAFKLVDGESIQAGETIKVYKDSSLKSVALEDVIVEGEPDTQNLVFTYILADESEQVVKVDISQFVSEAEFKAGLQVIGGEVSVNIAEGSESFLSVDMNGVKLSGVQDAIDAAVAVEQARAEDKEAGLNELITGVNTKLNMKVTELNTAIGDEKSRAEGEEQRIEGLLNAEVTRATDEEGRIEAKLDEEIRRSTAADGSIVNDMAIAHANINTAIDNLAGRLDVIEGEGEGSIKKAVAIEQARAEGEEARIEGLLNAEVARANAAEEANAAAIVSEAETARAAELALSGRLDIIEGEGEGSIKKAVDVEKERAEGKEAELADLIDAEAQRATAAELALSGRLDIIEGEGEGSIKKAVADEKARAKDAEATEKSERQNADADILSKLQQHAEEFNNLIANEDNEVRAYAEELVNGAKLKAEQDLTAHANATTGKVSLADRTRQLITVALSEKAGKIDDTTNDTYVDVVYSEHNSSASTVSDGIVTGDVLVSVLDNLWETFATA